MKRLPLLAVLFSSAVFADHYYGHYPYREHGISSVINSFMDTSAARGGMVDAFQRGQREYQEQEQRELNNKLLRAEIAKRELELRKRELELENRLSRAREREARREVTPRRKMDSSAAEDLRRQLEAYKSRYNR